MDPAALKELLERVRSGETDPDAAVSELRDLPFAELGYAMVDHHRALRQGVPEVVFGEGKTAAQIAGIMTELGRRGGNVLVTRVSAAQAAEVRALVPASRYAAVARTLTLEQAPIPPLSAGRVALVSAGTSDLPVAVATSLRASFGR